LGYNPAKKSTLRQSEEAGQAYHPDPMNDVIRSDGPLTKADLRRLADERRLIDGLFAHLTDDTAVLQGEVTALHRTCFFCDAVQRIDRLMAANILLATLDARLRALRCDRRLPEDSPRFSHLKTAIGALVADGLHALAERISSGGIVLPLGADERLHSWASALETPELGTEPRYAAAARVLREAADRLPKLSSFA
jgi:hypothetical protein